MELMGLLFSTTRGIPTLEFIQIKKMLLNECDNPTEAGNDTNGASFPRHDPSSSSIEAYAKDSANGVERILTPNAPVDYIAPGKTSVDYGNGACTNTKSKWFSGFKIHKWVEVGWTSPTF